MTSKRELTELTYTKKGEFIGRILGCLLESGQGNSWASGQTQRQERCVDGPGKLFTSSLTHLRASLSTDQNPQLLSLW